MWDELWIEHEPANVQLAAAIAKALELAADQVEVIDGIAGERVRTTEVVVHRTRGGGQFPVRIQLSGREPADRRVFCARLASALGCKLLGDDGNVNPFTFMLYEPGNATRVAVDIQQIEEHAPVVIGPYDASRDDEGHPTKPIRRVPTGQIAVTRGAQLTQLIHYMGQGLPRTPEVAWTPATTELYGKLQQLLKALAKRKATADELASVRSLRDALVVAFPDAEAAGWFVIEVLEGAALVLAEAWDPEAPALPTS